MIVNTTSAGKMTKRRIDEADEALNALKHSKDEKIKQEAEQQKQKMFAQQKAEREAAMKEIAQKAKK